MEFILKGEEKELKIKLSLRKQGEEVILIATDYNGRNWSIMAFKEGRFEKFDDIPDDIGIAINREGTMIEEGACNTN